MLSQLSGLNARVETVAKSGVLPFSTPARRRDCLPLRYGRAAHSGAGRLPVASEHPGHMHACGHDAHMAVMLTMCGWLSGHIRELPCNALVIFQPAEESDGGARLVVESGALEKYRVARIFAMHVQPGLPEGVLASRPGAFMATSSEVRIRLRGKSAHAARAREGRDAMLAGAQAVRAVYDFDHSLPAECRG